MEYEMDSLQRLELLLLVAAYHKVKMLEESFIRRILYRLGVNVNTSKAMQKAREELEAVDYDYQAWKESQMGEEND